MAGKYTGPSFHVVKQMAKGNGFEFYKGKGYYYFCYEKNGEFESQSVYVYRTTHLNRKSWQEEFKSFTKELSERGITVQV